MPHDGLVIDPAAHVPPARKPEDLPTNQSADLNLRGEVKTRRVRVHADAVAGRTSDGRQPTVDFPRAQAGDGHAGLRPAASADRELQPTA